MMEHGTVATTFDEWWHGRRFDADRAGDRTLAEEAWSAAHGETFYPCIQCGTWRTKAERATMLTVCDDCCIRNQAYSGPRCMDQRCRIPLTHEHFAGNEYYCKNCTPEGF